MWIFVIVTVCWIAILFEQLRCRADLYPHHPMTDFLWSTVCDGAKALGFWALLIVAWGVIGSFDTSSFLSWLGSF